MSKKEPKPSLEDMMEDLQRAGQESQSKTEEAALVTRADGSQMMKVRKRKRRSDQSRKEAFKKRRKNKFILIVGCILMVFLCVLAGVVGLAYYNSKSFHGKVQDSLAQSTGAKVDLGVLSIRPDNAAIDEAQFDWETGKGAIDFLKLKGIQANYHVKSLFGGTWGGSSVQASSGVMSLQSPTELSFGGTEGNLDFDFNYYRCNSLDVHLGSVKQKPFLKGVDATLKLPEVGMARLSLSGGVVNFPGFEDLEIENGVVLFGDENGDLITRLVGEDQRGYLGLEGKIAYQGGEPISLAGKAEGFPLVRFLSDDTKRFFGGNLDSDQLAIRVTPNKREAMVVDGRFSSDRFELRDFQFLNELSVLLGHKWYDNPRFSKTATGEIFRDGNRVEFRNLVLEESTNLKMTGDIKFAANGELSGQLRVGIPVGIGNMIRGKVPPGMFSQPVEGFLWTVVNLGGTAISVSDDFGARLGSLDPKTPASSFDESLPQSDKREDSFEELTE